MLKNLTRQYSLRIAYAALIALALAFFVAFFLFPVWQILRGGLLDSGGKPTSFYLAEVFRNPLYRSCLYNSFTDWSLLRQDANGGLTGPAPAR
ncbi:MAG: hypothetical protein J6Y80_06855 [Victivallales bacterium]|nr:hypothetical protein [Victivallales bacterium]